VVNIFTGRFEDLVSKETINKLAGLATDFSSFLRKEKVHPKQRVLFSVSTGAFLFFLITASLLFPSTFAFGQNASAGNIQNSTANNTNSSASTTNNNTQPRINSGSTSSQPPVTTKISERGIYQCSSLLFLHYPCNLLTCLKKWVSDGN